MKKFLLSILLAIVVGGIFGFVTYKKMSNAKPVMETMLETQVYAIQAGVFTSLDNAQTLANIYSGIIVPDNDKYRVYVAISTSSNALSLLKTYYDQKGISYYVKEIQVSSSFIESLQEYESLLTATTLDNYQPIITNILKEYQKTLT